MKKNLIGASVIFIPIILVIAVVCVGVVLPFQLGADPKYPDSTDQLILFRLQARIARDNQQIMQAQQMYEQATKDQQEAGPQYQHAIEVARGKLPKPPDGKVWVSREDPANALQFTLADAGPVAPASVAKKDGKTADKP